MNRFRDFIYKQNDILIVLIILAAAALLIYNRLTLIMDYPADAAPQDRPETTQAADPAQASEDPEDSEVPGEPGEADAGDGDDAKAGQTED